VKKADVTKFEQDSAEYIVMHALWQKSRGRAPSASYWWMRNPKKALQFAKKAAYFPIRSTYLEGARLAKYCCYECGATNCKLWREWQTSPPKLLCARCAAKDQKKSIRGIDQEGTIASRPLGHMTKGMIYERTDQIGRFVPALPTENEKDYWGYSAAPTLAIKWWRELPTLSTES